MDIVTVMASRRIPFDFPDAVRKEAEQLPERVRDEDLVGRMDLRSHYVVTIDGSDAKDLDDAISVERIEGGYRVGVHIADVSHYVREGSALDREARERGTSVYLVDRVIPMLPERLSNGIASLNPGVDRLTVSAVMELDDSGRVLNATFLRSVINTRHRLTYDGVNQVLDGTLTVEPELAQLLADARKVRDLRYQLREKRGAVDFDLPEPKVILDGDGHVERIEIRGHGLAESVIEECMLLANEAVAKKLRQAKLPGMFRVHEAPLAEKMEQFRELIQVLGYRLPKQVTPKALQAVLQKADGTPEERVISSALLRSMRQARYGDQNLGHFGLASKEYTHFTSPIRRYPDLFVHRVLTEYLAKQMTPAMKAAWQREVADVAEKASRRERDAMEAERESVLIKEVEYMRDKIGWKYRGIVSGVTAFGIFVELPTLIEGLVRVEDLPSDSWSFDRVHYRLTGTRSGKSYRIGDALDVVVARVDVTMRRIDLVLEDHVRQIKPPRVKADRKKAAARPAAAARAKDSKTPPAAKKKRTRPHRRRRSKAHT